MTKETMTIHEALTELKIIGDRIDSAMNHNFILENKKGNKVINGMPITEAVETIKSRYQKVNDLIKRRNAIKRAVSLSNASTDITIGDKIYKVAEAIEMNNNGIMYLELLMGTLERQHKNAQNTIKAANDKVVRDAEEHALNAVGKKESTNAADYEKVYNEYIERYTHEMIDPIGALKEIERLEVEISTFKTKVDSALSISNALTTIEIEY